MLTVTKRRGLVVWVYSLKQIKALRHYGTVMYVSKKMKYVYLYLNDSQIESVSEKLTHLRFVKAVEPSMRPDLATHYAGALTKHDDDEDDEDQDEAGAVHASD